MNIKYNWVFKLGCLNMLSSLIVGARYGHTGALDEPSRKRFDKAQLYSFANCTFFPISAIGLFSSALVSAGTSIGFRIAVCSFVSGQLLFCVPLYAFAITGERGPFNKLMPVGGVGMMAGWVGLVFAWFYDMIYMQYHLISCMKL